MIKRCNPNLKDFEQKLSELQAFLASDSEGLTAVELVELNDLSDKVKSVWIKENAIFALTRISETTEKISNYKEYLEKGITEYKLKSKEVNTTADASTSPLSVDSVDSGEVLPMTTKTPDVYEEGAGLSLCEDPNHYFTEVEAVLEKSQELLDAQVPSTPVLHKQETGKKRAYTYPQYTGDTKQTRTRDSFDGGLSACFSARSDETDEPEVPIIPHCTRFLCCSYRYQCSPKLIWLKKEGNAKMNTTIYYHIFRYVINTFPALSYRVEVCFIATPQHRSSIWVDLRGRCYVISGGSPRRLSFLLAVQ